MFNKAKYDALPDKMKAIIANAVEAASQDMAWKAIDRYSKDYVEMQTKDNVKFYKTPDAILKKQLEVYDEVVKKKAAENPLFKEILQSQIAFAQRATRWEQDTVVNRRMAFDHYFGAERGSEEDLMHRRIGKAPFGQIRMVLRLFRSTLLPAAARMNVQQFLHTVDGISTWVGKAAAWLIIGLMTLVCVEVFKRYIMNMPTAWIFDASNMFYGTLFMLAGAYTLAQNAHVRGDFLYSSMRPRTQADLRSRAVHRLFPARDRRPHLRGLRLCGAVLADRRAFDGDGGRAADLPFQDGHPDRRRPGDAAGLGRDRALHRLSQDRRMAEPAQGCRGDRRRRGAACA